MVSERLAGCLLLALLLAGCGVDGPPLPPEPEEPPSRGITIGGRAEAGVVGSS